MTISFFQLEKKRLEIKRDEALWQYFFEENTWIFGYGLQYVINVPLEKQKIRTSS